ncbi:hypothetical protein [Paraburkholderia sp. BL21I4N1]|uniref:hypothetical protein n=1 Tax=Paraburkholderia sp. BL21I4N1 TaxID=1938801 RepID=UPI000D4DB322|nr:hypothetical protein [Paraburkholderia sp. BL21I4N1]PQV45828.1 hypothetical protein B0G83_11566 [Paraburkholderia sp. BL21I4N1]
MKGKSVVNAIPLFALGKANAVASESPVFEIIEDFEVESKLYADGTTVRVLLRRQLNHTPPRYASGPYRLDLTVGGQHTPHYGVSEATACEAACRFLLKHVEGVIPTLN